MTCILTITSTSDAFDVLNAINKKYNRATVFVGVSKCSPRDTFDEIKGKDIAEHRAFKQYYGFLYTLFNEMQAYYSQAAGAAFDFKVWASQKAETQKAIINKY